MKLKDRLKHALLFARSTTDSILDELTDDADWIRPASPNGNHALWITGHLAFVDNHFTRLLDPELTAELTGFKETYGRGSTPVDELSAYPSASELRTIMREQRSAFLQALENCSEEDFDKPSPEGAPEFMPNVGLIFQMVAWHEGLHTGQLTTIHRLLGHDPLRG